MKQIMAIEPFTHTFFGVLCTGTQYVTWLVLKNRGECPFCHRTGLKKQYGSDKKHIAACAQKGKSDVGKSNAEQGAPSDA